MAYEEILSLLWEKQKIFSQVEQISQSLQIAGVDEIVECMAQRQSLFQLVPPLDARLSALVQGDNALQSALYQHADRGDLSGDLGRVYDAAQGVKAVINRLLKGEEGIRRHFDDEKRQILENIEKIGGSASSVAGRYYDTVRNVGGRQYGRENAKKI